MTRLTLDHASTAHELSARPASAISSRSDPKAKKYPHPPPRSTQREASSPARSIQSTTRRCPRSNSWAESVKKSGVFCKTPKCGDRKKAPVASDHPIVRLRGTPRSAQPGPSQRSRAEMGAIPRLNNRYLISASVSRKLAPTNRNHFSISRDRPIPNPNPIRQHPNKRQMTILIIKIQAISNHKCIRYLKTTIVRLDRHLLTPQLP